MSATGVVSPATDANVMDGSNSPVNTTATGSGADAISIETGASNSELVCIASQRALITTATIVATQTPTTTQTRSLFFGRGGKLALQWATPALYEDLANPLNISPANVFRVVLAHRREMSPNCPTNDEQNARGASRSFMDVAKGA